jgi:Carboxypeptidase regulatory-like domain
MSKYWEGKSMRQFLRVWLVGLTIFVACGTIPALAQVDTANLSGVVLDPSGAAIPEAKVTITKNDTGATRGVNANADGA